MNEAGVRPPGCPEDFIEVDCEGCDGTTWIPPGAIEAAREAGTPAVAVCSAECAKKVVKTRGPLPITVIDTASPSLGYRIDRMFAFVAEDDTGEGVISSPLPGMPGSMPLIGADMERMNSLRPIAQDMAKMSGRTVRLVRFDQRTEIEVFEP